WVAVNGASALRKLSLAQDPPVVGPLVSLPPETIGTTSYPSTALSLAVLPGAPGTVVAALRAVTNPRVIVFDDGVPRPAIVSQRNAVDIGQVVAGPAGYVFGYDNQSSGGAFSTMRVDATGVTLVSALTGLVGGIQNAIHYSAGRVYADWGDVLDVSDPTS